MLSPLILKLTTDLSERYPHLIRQAKELTQVCDERKTKPATSIDTRKCDVIMPIHIRRRN